jgi:hypothetical protein
MLEKRNILVLILIFSIVLTLSFKSVENSDQEISIMDKFNPRFAYDYLHSLAISNPKEIVSAIIWLVEDEESTDMTIDRLQCVAENLIKQHNATIWYIGQVFPFIHIYAAASEIEKIAAYEFVNEVNID